MRFRISPEMEIAMGTIVMRDNESLEGQPVEMLASRRPCPEEMEAYERVLGDAITGDSSHFAREDYVEEAWRIVDPILKNAPPIHEYDLGTWGPHDESVSPQGGWHNPITPAHEASSRSKPSTASISPEGDHLLRSIPA
jgi:glucose-6-phosphate 1-dehydrogenase